MDLKILKRRAEMLDAVSTGLHPSAVVAQLAEKYGVTERALWSDWQRREKWVPVLLNLEKYAEFTDVIEQKLNAVQKNDNKGMGVSFNFLSFLEGLGWGSVLAVHALKLKFEVYSLGWLEEGWKYCRRSCSYRRRFDLSYPVSVQCFDTGTVLVSVKASVRPFRLDLDGLLSLTSLLGEVRACLRAPCIPEPSSWVVVQWHLNRDSEEISGSGL